ncbi:MAG TPA: acetate--CoA ligase family protein [Methanoregulaceae archaeon]|jgi:acetyl coenzyme A synthetase (ADP forming)-like protein|nr:acetate--CoA ligase family protein [Methanolinea sp.]MDD3090298.1 acetate--CoA ligase family protein [Methanoregulaceae archaeon]MDD5048558.1 acetate--CoA ligase family protein [Methanoregulaceae archaeon]HOP67100.1 acetate--CoA ligase family protein [Methanoregulaceae archaeon]HPJ74267.1 acetate--CoA ligase family protein [Methanoregulaceae archaeon]
MNPEYEGKDRMLSEAEGYRLLKSCAIPVPRFDIASGSGKAAEIADEIGYPVVMKVISPQIVHKSDAGGVITGIQSREEARAAYEKIVGNARRFRSDAEITGIIVEEQCPPGLELIIGGRRDPAFGPVITFGMGGTLVELFGDVTTRILPISDDEITNMVRSIKGYPLIAGYRDRPPLDEELLIKTIRSAASLFEEHPEISEFDINPLILYEKGAVAVDARILVIPGHTEKKITRTKPIPERLMHPGSVALIGASSDPNKIGYAVMRNLLPFPGDLYPVNPHSGQILGRKVYRKVGDIPGRVDAAVIAIPARLVRGVMEELAEKGARLAIILSSGFREIGPEGRKGEDEVIEAAERGNIRVIGPNCLGIIMPHQKLNTTFDPITPRPGRIGFVSQSGAIITTITDWSLPEQIGFSAVISVGNQADLGFIEYIRYLSEDENTRAIILYVEEIPDGREFMALCKRITPKTPIIALKSGSSEIGKRAASSHTGSLAGSFQVYQAAFLQSGIIPVFSIKEAFDVAELLASEGYPRGKRAIVVTTAGGFAVLSSDYAQRYGVELPRLPADLLKKLNAFLPAIWSHNNPMDIIGDGGADRYARVFDILIDHQDVWDIAIVIAVPSALLDSSHLGQEIVRFSRHTEKMVVGCLLGGDSMKSGVGILRENKIPNYSDIESAFRAVGRSLKWCQDNL